MEVPDWARGMDPRFVGLPCPLCAHIVELGKDDICSVRWGGRVVHRVCGLRGVLGGIGHLVDHDYWCLTRGDPDGGMCPYESAVAVDAWVAEHGLAAAVALSPLSG